ncbi:MAG: hypothetical protein IIC82_06510 [Chloroflexi bacterium]|nr:hypothetical protein [Chloroflexota bacterium]
MGEQLLISLAASIGAAAAAGMSGFHLAKRRINGAGPTTYVRLSAEDSDRVEKVDALLERLVALEEQTHAMLRGLSQELSALRRERAWQDGYEAARRDTGVSHR